MGEVHTSELSLDGPTGPDAPVEENPTPDIPDKFKNEDGSVNTEALLKSYSELENGLPQRGDDGKFTAQDKPEAETSDDSLKIEQPEGAEGLFTETEMSAWMDEVLVEGDLSDETFKAIVAKGLPEALVRSHVEGLKSQQQANRAAIFEVAGGEENYKSMLQWAGNNLSTAQANAFDAVFDSRDQAQIQLAVAGLYAQYTGAQGGSLVHGSAGAGGNNIKPFASTGEMVQAMSDERYTRGDADFHAEVEARIKGMK